MMIVQASKKGDCLSAEEKTKVDCQIRAASAAASQASLDLAGVGLLITKVAEEVGKLVSFTRKLEEELVEVSGQIDILIIENSYIRPQQLLSALPIQLEDIVPLKQELLCVLCAASRLTWLWRIYRAAASCTQAACLKLV
jgi:hypothetical protein